MHSWSLKAEARIGVGAVLAAAALLPPLAGLLEGQLVTHLLCQYPLLVGGGAMIGATLALTRLANWTAPSALLAGTLACVFWLVPRWIDAALADQAVNAAKAVCLVILSGLPLGWGWATGLRLGQRHSDACRYGLAAIGDAHPPLQQLPAERATRSWPCIADACDTGADHWNESGHIWSVGSLYPIAVQLSISHLSPGRSSFPATVNMRHPRRRTA